MINSQKLSESNCATFIYAFRSLNMVHHLSYKNSQVRQKCCIVGRLIGIHLNDFLLCRFKFQRVNKHERSKTAKDVEGARWLQLNSESTIAGVCWSYSSTSVFVVFPAVDSVIQISNIVYNLIYL